MVDNPAWLDLNSALTKLQRRQEQLLVNCTPLHPLVRDVVRQIEDVKKQMARVHNSRGKDACQVAGDEADP